MRVNLKRHLSLGYVYTIPDSFFPGTKTIPGIGLLFTHQNMYSAFGGIFVTKRTCAAPTLSLKVRIAI